MRLWCLCLLLALLPLRPATAEPTSEAAVRQLLVLAEASSWFALNDGGDLDYFDAGLERLDEAVALLRGLPPEAAARLAPEIEMLRRELLGQRDDAHDKLAAVFPLSRYYGTTLLVDPDALGSYELVDDARDRAVEQALAGLVALDWSGWRRRPQLDVVFASRPAEAEVEAIALALFNSDPRFFVHNAREVLAAGGVPGPAAFGADRLLLVTLERQAAGEDDSFYIAEGRLLALDPAEATTARVMGFGHDRTDLIWPLAAVNLLLWAAALGWQRWLAGRALTLPDLVVPSLGFVAGRVAPWIILPAMAQIRPAADSFAPLTFWWPAAAGVALVALPLILARTIGRRLPLVAAHLAWSRGPEALGLALACGAGAWWATTLLAYRDLAGLVLLALLLPGLWAVASLLSRVGRAGEPAGLWLAPLLAALIGLGVATADAGPVAAASALALAALVAMPPRREPVPLARERPSLAETYRPLDVLERLEQAAAPPAAGRIAWIALTGPAGAGKTAHAHALLQRLAAEPGPPLLLLEGSCERLPDGAPVPFGPFQQCLAQHLRLDVRQAVRREDALPEGLADLLLGPLAPLFGAGGLDAGERDLHAFVARALRQQAARARVVLLIDEAQWLDEASAGLVAHLRATLPPGAPGALLVILAGRREAAAEPFAELAAAATEVVIPPLDEAEARGLLREGYGLAAEVADWIIDWLGGNRGLPLWPGALGEVVDQLAAQQALQAGPEGLAFSPGFDRSHPPLTGSALEEVRRALERLPDARELLAAAACLGRSFEAGLLAAALEEPRARVLQRLQALERETALVRDVLEIDDLFEFRSQRTLDAVREVLALHLRGPAAVDVPQAVRETHAAVARALRRQGDGSLATLLRQATHWYGAGRSHAAEAIATGLEAARRLAQLQRFQDAEGFLAQAAEHAALVGREGEVAAERLWVAAERAHVTGSGARSVAEAGLAVAPATPRLALAVARACYEAGRDGGPSLAAAAERLALAVAESPAAAPLDRAQGLHFAGLALRFLPGRQDAARERLAAALALAEAAGPAGDAIEAQIANSSALLEASRGPEGHALAEQLLKRSIALKQAAAIADRPGLARSYGGLGLLLLEGGDRARLQEAEDWLAKDLALAEELGDGVGRVKVRLWLGRCHLLQGETERAEESFAAAQTLAVAPADVVGAAAGLLAVAGARRQADAYAVRAAALLALLGEGPVPAESRVLVALALDWPEAPAEADALRRKLEAGE